MDLKYCLSQLSVNSMAIQQLIEDINQKQACWKPTDQEWSILEVVNHLVDEEKEDFRSRLSHLLSGTSQPWPSIAPQKWVNERAYNQKDIQESIEKFMDERIESLEWLRLQENREFTIRYTNPPFEGLSAGDLLFSWVAHDMLHLRQIVELKWKYSKMKSEPFSIEYAGDW
jgi:hypothetical protein